MKIEVDMQPDALRWVAKGLLGMAVALEELDVVPEATVRNTPMAVDTATNISDSVVIGEVPELGDSVHRVTLGRETGAEETPSPEPVFTPPAAEIEAAPPPPPETAVPELDAGGLPWDQAIHSSGKTIKKTGKRKGCWNYRKNITEKQIAEVEESLRGVAPTAAPDLEAAPPPPGETVDIPPPPPPAQSTGTVTFPGLLAEITKALADGVLQQSTVDMIIRQHGLANIALVSTRLDLVPVIHRELFGA
jgi:hypothetical protein